MRPGPEVRVERGAQAGQRWEFAELRDRPAGVRQLVGYDEQTSAPAGRREIGRPRAVLIVELGPALALELPGETRSFSSFVVGPGAPPTNTQHPGWQRGVQIELSPSLARALLGPLDALEGDVVGLEDVVGDTLPLATLRRCADSWAAVLGSVTSVLERCAHACPPDRRVQWAVATIERAGGNVEIGCLQRELGLSRTHLARLFREHVGMTPKHYARRVRFEAALARIQGGVALAEVAAQTGYSDQSHLSRESQALVGLSPRQLAM